MGIQVVRADGPGEETVRQQRSDPAATAFWRTALPCGYRERESADEVTQEFTADAH